LIVINAIEEDRADASDVMLASEEIIKSLRQSSKCAACGEWLIAPERSTYVSEEQVSNLWVCPKCANEFETSIYLTQEVPLTPEMVDTFFPTLLVA
jgi:ribosomal protein L37AE/L43A